MNKCALEPAIDDPEYIREKIRENLEAQRRIQAELTTIDAGAGLNVWRATNWGSPMDVRIEIFRPETAMASRSAAGISQALERAGFETSVVAESRGSALEEPRLECGVEGSAAALFLQGAFRIAEISVMLTVDYRLTNTLRLHVGEEGLICRKPSRATSVVGV